MIRYGSNARAYVSECITASSKILLWPAQSACLIKFPMFALLFYFNAVVVHYGTYSRPFLRVLLVCSHSIQIKSWEQIGIIILSRVQFRNTVSNQFSIPEIFIFSIWIQGFWPMWIYGVQTTDKGGQVYDEWTL